MDLREKIARAQVGVGVVKWENYSPFKRRLYLARADAILQIPEIAAALSAAESAEDDALGRAKYPDTWA